MKKVKTKINQGSELLVPRELWVPEVELQGDESKVLNHPIVKKAFSQILKLHKPKHEIAFVSLCTATRPYSQSRKWKKYIEEFGKKCDLIISSNGGIIPIEFEGCYPYLTYDAHGESKYDKLYITVLEMRLKLFFQQFPYKYIIFNFRPNLRNKIAAENFIKSYTKGQCIILPTEKAYFIAKKNGFKPGGNYYPDLSNESMFQLKKAVQYFSK